MQTMIFSTREGVGIEGSLDKLHVIDIICTLQKEVAALPAPAIDQIIAEFGKKPFLILICCLLSLRAKDSATIPAARQLFEQARTPEDLVSIPLHTLEKLFYSIGFYRHKAQIVRFVSYDLLVRFKGKVPQTEQELLSIKGIGRKTANAVLGYAFDIPSLCVDTHVHKIANRLGWVMTKTPEQTERALKNLIPSHYWIDLNRLLVTWGQYLCTPISPFCSRCAIAHFCPKIGVKRGR